MQIVQKLAGYTLGRSDLIRRAMSKKKASVMEKERKNFVYGNPEEGVPGCVGGGIPESIAQKIYDEMMDFAQYAFNKSHAAVYAVVAYQTAYLKYYYPVEYMAALMTSVMGNPGKVAEYILSCRQMDIKILPPDVNEGEGGFSVSGGAIRYGLSAIKSVGTPVIDALVQERELGGPFVSLQDFIERLAGREVNRRVVENFIKAGALDSLDGNRQQKMLVYASIMDSYLQNKKTTMTGQLSLFDLVSEEEQEQFKIRFPDVPEYEKELLLSFEKDVLGVYISGHPLEEYEERWRKNITAVTSDFQWDEEKGESKVQDNEKVIVGGMITGKTIKYTKNNKVMAFLTVEDLVGTVEVIVFPNVYERQSGLLNEDAKVFVNGHVSAEEEKASKLICDRIYSFDEGKREVWIQFPDQASCLAGEEKLHQLLREEEGPDGLVLYAAREHSVKRLPANWNIQGDKKTVTFLRGHFGEENVKVVEKRIENLGRMN